MNKAMLLSAILITLLTAFRNSDKPVYKEIPGSSYHPVMVGKKTIYKAGKSTYSVTYDTVLSEWNGRKYTRCVTDFGTSQTVCYYREQDGMVVYIKPGQKAETIQIPAKSEIGRSWYESDSSWRYTITSVNATFETPDAKYLDCLVIQSENMDRGTNPDHYLLYKQYYQRGRGYIGTEVGGFIYSYRVHGE